MLKYNSNPLIVVRAKLYNLLEKKMIKRIVEFLKKPSIRLISVSSLGAISVRAIIVSIIFIAGFLIGAVMLFKKRDVK